MSPPAFTLFGVAHFLTLAVVLCVSLIVCYVARLNRAHRLVFPFALFLIVHEMFKIWFSIGVDGRPWQQSLPLDLCRLNAFLCAYLLIHRSYRVFEVSYFWAMAGSVSALMTPNIQVGFPDVRYLSFITGHASGVLAVLYAIFGFGFLPRLRSLGIALLVTAVYSVAVGAVNYLLDTNYLFLRAKPEAASVLDLLGPWPQYLLGLAVIAVLGSGLCYLPFAMIARFRRTAKPP